jgi:predicted HTH domain antitoxin
MQVAIALPELDAQELGKSEQEIRLDLAIFFYLVWQMPAGRCAEYAGIAKVVFLDELGRRRIPVNYDLSALEQDRQNWATYLTNHDRHQRYHLS